MSPMSLALLGIMKLDGYDRFRWPAWTVPAIIAALLIILTLWKLTLLGIWWWRQPIKSSHRLFRELCNHHKLVRVELKAMQKLASAQSIEPSLLFIDPELWKNSLDDGKQDWEKLSKLFQQLFGLALDRAK